MHPFQAVRESIREELHTTHALPPLLDEAVNFFSKSHIYYRTFKQVGIHNNAFQDLSKGHPAVYGAALQLVGDYTTIGSYAINVALVTKCALDLLREYRQLGENYQILRQAVNWQYPLYQPVTWKIEKEYSTELVSTSHQLVLQVQFISFLRQTLKIACYAWDVFKQMFKLSMCLCDAYLLFNDDPQMRYEACTELVAEWDNYQLELKENQERMVEEIEKGAALTDRILNRLGVEKDSTFIIDQLRQTIEGLAEGTEEVLDDIYDIAEETMDSIYVPGKITPFHIDLSEGKIAKPTLPHGRFPPWAGQKVQVVSPQKSKAAFKSFEKMISDKIDLPNAFKDSLKGLMHMGKRVRKFCQGQSAKGSTVSPFA